MSHDQTWQKHAASVCNFCIDVTGLVIDYESIIQSDCYTTAYNNSLRRFMGLPWHNSASEMFVNLNIKSFGEMLRSFVYSFRSRIMISGNLMLIGIDHSPCIIYSNLWAWWRTLLFVNL